MLFVRKIFFQLAIGKDQWLVVGLLIKGYLGDSTESYTLLCDSLVVFPYQIIKKKGSKITQTKKNTTSTMFLLTELRFNKDREICDKIKNTLKCN